MTAQCIDVPADEVDAFISEKMTDYGYWPEFMILRAAPVIVTL